MTRTQTLALALAALAGTVPAAFADGQPVDRGRAANTSVTVQLGDGESLQLEILAAELSGGPQLLLQTARCDNDDACSYDDFDSALPGGALSIDPQTAVARLDTSLAGRQLVVRWQPGSGAELGSGHIEGDGAGFSGSNFVGNAAIVTVQYAGDTCTGSGGVGDATVAEVDPTGSRTTTPVDRLRIPDGVTLRC
jgi:hypothetical protein